MTPATILPLSKLPWVYFHAVGQNQQQSLEFETFLGYLLKRDKVFVCHFEWYEFLTTPPSGSFDHVGVAYHLMKSCRDGEVLCDAVSNDNRIREPMPDQLDAVIEPQNPTLYTRAITTASFMYCAVPALILYRVYGGISMIANIMLMVMARLFVNEPYALISTAISSTHISLRGNSRSFGNRHDYSRWYWVCWGYLGATSDRIYLYIWMDRCIHYSHAYIFNFWPSFDPLGCGRDRGQDFQDKRKERTFQQQ